MVKVREDLTGKVFGRLTVVKRNENDHVFPNGKAVSMWDCDCNCGNKITTMSWSLKNGDTRSCGCLQKELAAKTGSKMWKQYNTYDLSGEYGIGYTNKGEEFWFDLEDYDKIKDYYWYYDTHGYVITKPTNCSQFSLHRFVMNAPDDIVIDHINHPKIDEKKYDNRKSNLRYANDSQNSMNRHKNSNNTTGVKGVYFKKDKKAKPWYAAIGLNYKMIYLGYFDNFEDAVKARKEAEEKYFGEWNCDTRNEV